MVKGQLEVGDKTLMIDIADDDKKPEIKDPQLAKVYARLLEVREKRNLVLPRPSRLREKYVQYGVEKELKLRDYQVQAVVHLLMMSRFFLGEDCGLGKCKTLDSRVLTDKGLLRLGDLAPKGIPLVPDTFYPLAEPLRVWTGQEWADVRRFYYGGVKPIRRIKTKRGYETTGSFVHPLWVRRSDGIETFVPTKDLQIGDWCCIVRSEVEFPQEEPNLPVPDLSKMGLVTIEQVPGYIFRATKSHTINFIRDYFDSDRLVDKDAIGVSSASERLLRDVQMLLLRFGILSSRCSKEINDHTYWQLTICDEDAGTFERIIGSALPRKKNLPSVLRGSPPRSNYDPIVSITEEFQEVADIEVDDPSHAFVSDGFLNHNTIECISALCHIWDRMPDHKVIVLTTKSAAPQWVSEFQKFTAGVKTFLCRGSKAKRQEIRAAFMMTKEPCVLVMNYRTAVVDITDMQGWKGASIIFDEATAFKSTTAQVHQVCKHLSFQAVRTWALSGTLIKNNLMEGYGIYNVVVPGLFGSKNRFMQDYCIIQMQRIANGRQIPIVKGYRKKDIVAFKRVIDPYFLGRPKHEVAPELPPLTTREIRVELTPEQSKKYDEALSGLLTIGGEEKETTKLTSIIYCQEIADHPILIKAEGESSKMEALIEILTEGDLAGEKVIIFTRFRQMVNHAIPVLKEHKVPCVRVTGDENDMQRKAAMETFQNPESNVNVIWITMAGGDAINLQAAKAIIFYDSPWSAGDYIQCLGRMIRIGSEHENVFAYHMIADGTVDERVQEVLNKKMALIEAVIGKRVKGEKGDPIEFKAGGEIDDLFSLLKQDAVKRTRGRK